MVGLRSTGVRLQARCLARACFVEKVAAASTMAFILEYLSYVWDKNHDDAATYKEWTDFLDVAEKDRKRE